MLQWALLGIFIAVSFLAYIIIQGTRAALAWREAAKAGDTKVIRDIVDDALKMWGSQKRPKPVSAEVWRGIQSMQLAGVAPDYVRVSCIAESEQKMVDGRWVEIRNPLQEGVAITAKAADMLFWELPHYRPENIQIDIYTDYRDDEGRTRRECIMTTQAAREDAKDFDWEEWTADQIADALGAVYKINQNGRPEPISPLAPPENVETPEEIEARLAEAKAEPRGVHA
jgi:hypothetical protein